MPALDDVYRRFGDCAEAAQLLETQLGNMLLWVRAEEDCLLTKPNPARASELAGKIDRYTLGQLLKEVNKSTESLDRLESLLSRALEERNRLFHSFYRQHNFRRNSDEGRAVMIEDIESIHCTILEAYKAVLLLSGIDLDAMDANMDLPTRHLPL